MEKIKMELTKFRSLADWKPIYLFFILLKGIKLHVLFPLLGFFSFIEDRKINKEIIPLVAMSLIGALLALFYKDMSSFYRVVQLTGIIFATNYVMKKDIDIVKFADIALAASGLVLLYDLFQNQPLIHYYFDQPIPRYKGIIREYNFSGAVYFLLFYIYDSKKLRTKSILSLLLMLSTFSRGAMVCVAVYPIVKLVLNLQPRVRYLAFYGVAFLPFIFISFKTLSPSFYDKIDRMSSFRISIQERALQELKDKPYGVGYFRGRAILLDAIHNEKPKFDAVEPHNVFVQVLYEFGFIGFILFLASLHMTVMKSRNSLAIIMGLMLFSNLNGLHELAFYMLVMIIPGYENKLNQE
jgi:hypothetical protein